MLEIFEPYFRFWKFTALENNGAENVRIDNIILRGRAGGSDLIPDAVSVVYGGGFSVLELSAPIANAPNVSYEFEYPIAPRELAIDYTEPTGSHELSGIWSDWPFATTAQQLQLIRIEPLGVFVSVGDNSTISTSVDGVTWAARTAPSSGNYTAVAYSEALNRIVAVRDSGASPFSIYSDNGGVTWQNGNLTANRAWGSIAYSPTLGRFVAFCWGLVGDPQFAYSSDGINWTTGLIPGAFHFVNASVCWADDLGIFCAIGSTAAATSSDGINWTRSTIPAGRTFRKIVRSVELGLFIAIHSGGVTDNFWRSVDGVTWNQYTMAATDIFDLIWSDSLDLFLALTANSSTLWSSTDGLNWNTITLPFANSNLLSYSDSMARLLILDSSTGDRSNISDSIVNPGGAGDAPALVKVEVSNDKIEWFEIAQIETSIV